MDELERKHHKRRRRKKHKPVRRTAGTGAKLDIRGIMKGIGDAVRRFIAFANENKMVYVIMATAVALIAVVVVGIVRINKADSGETEVVMVGVDEDGKPIYETRKVSSSSDDEEEEVEEDPVVLAYKEDAKNGYMNNCIFLGDSRTVAAVSYGFINDDMALAEVGISHTQVAGNTFINNSGQQYTLTSYLNSHQYPVVYMNYGVNGMVGSNETSFRNSYEDLVDQVAELCPDSKIVLMGVWPVDDYGTYKGRVSNEAIVSFNSWLQELATEKGLHYLDVETVLTDEDGQMKAEYDAGDGLHYRAAAYNEIIDYIIQHPVPGVSDDGEYVVHYVQPSGAYKKIMTEDVELPSNVTVVTPTPSSQSTCNHEFYDWTTEGNKRIRACKLCGYTEYEEIESTECSHSSYTEIGRVDSTTSSEGYIEYRCDNCGTTWKTTIAKKTDNSTPTTAVEPTSSVQEESSTPQESSTDQESSSEPQSSPTEEASTTSTENSTGATQNSEPSGEN